MLPWAPIGSKLRFFHSNRVLVVNALFEDREHAISKIFIQALVIEYNKNRSGKMNSRWVLKTCRSRIFEFLPHFIDICPILRLQGFFGHFGLPLSGPKMAKREVKPTKAYRQLTHVCFRWSIRLMQWPMRWLETYPSTAAVRQLRWIKPV